MNFKSLLCGLGLGSAVLSSVLSAELTDPTRPPRTRPVDLPAQATGASDWQLRMTRISAGQAVAVLNGRVVQPGDEVGGARVLAIEPSAVELIKGEKRFQVELLRIPVKRQAPAGASKLPDATRGHEN